MALTARISKNSDAIIQELVLKTGKTKVEIIEEALESYRYLERMRILNEQYERLRSDKKAWEQELKERHELDGTLMDGLEDE
jgi:Ribbon-helix-helix protein, copG family